MNILIKNTLALLPRDGGFALENADIRISGDSILKITELGGESPDFKADTVIDGDGYLTMPGLINAHTHSYMSVLRSVGDDRAFNDWLFNCVSPREDKMQPHDAYVGAMLAACEMIKSGTTTFCDMQMHIGQTTLAAQQSGMRAVISRGLVGCGSNEAGSSRIDEALKEMADFESCDRLTFMLGPHAPYTCDEDFLCIVAILAKQKNLPVHMHLSESHGEVDACINKYHCTPIGLAERCGLFDTGLLCAHCVHLTPDDIKILADKKASVVSCPASNMKLGNGFAPAEKLIEAGVNLCLGTDGAASNNSLNLFRELGLFCLIHKGKNETPQCISALQGVKCVTENAAAAVNLKDKVGVLQTGAKADIIMLNLNSASLVPPNDIISSLCYSATGAEVENVIINGEIVMRDRHILTVDEEKIYAEAREISRRLNS